MMVRLSQFWWAESPEHAPRRIIFPSLGSAGFEEKLLGKGAHGIVVKGREAHTLEEFLLKVADARGDSIEHMAQAIAARQREYEMLRKRAHPNATCVLAQMQNRDLRQTSLLLDWADMPLRQFIHRQGLPSVAKTFMGE